MSAGYAIFNINVTNPENYKHYIEQVVSVAETLPVEVEEKVKSLDEIKDVQVEITFDPPWTQDLISEEAKLELGML